MRDYLLATLLTLVPACSPAVVATPSPAASEKPALRDPDPVARPPQASPEEARRGIQQNEGAIQEDCGDLKCYAFLSPGDGLSYVLRKEQPRVLGFGEAHGRPGQAGRSTVRRFAEDLLPSLAQHAGRLTVELLAPPTGCQTSTQAARATSSEITKGQAETNSSEYVTMGHFARGKGIVPDILRASCEDMKRIEEAGEDGVFAMMETIATRSAEELLRSAAQSSPERPLVLGYGGAVHNDRFPRAGREAWSYVARVEAAGLSYLEVDLVRPELLGEGSVYEVMPWAPAVRALPDATKSYLIQVAERSYALTLPPDAKARSGEKPALAEP